MARRKVPKSWLAGVLIGLSTAMMAQQASPPGAAPPQSIPKFTSRTELVTVPVIVSRHGEHVVNLTKDDFAVEEDGQPESLASFEEIRSPNSTLKPVTPAPGIYTNEVVADGPVTMVVILLDLINTPYVYQENTKKKLLEYLQTDYRGDRPTMLVALHPNGLRVLHDFTTDPRVLVSLVQRLKNNVEHDPGLDEQVRTETSGTLFQEIDVKKEYDEMEREFIADFTGSETFQEQLQGDRLATTLYQLQQLAHALSAVRGMKSLVWATGGITLAYSMS